LKRRSIHFRLAVWYFLSVAAIIVLFAAGSWLALRTSMYYAIDRDLRYRMSAVVPLIESHSLKSREQFEHVFADSSDSSITGVFVQITDGKSNMIYESDILLFHRIPVLPPGSIDGAIELTTLDRHGWPMRIANRRILIQDTALTVHVIEPLRDIFNSLREYALSLCLLVPLALLLTTAVGYSMSRRALAPVEQIRKQTAAIEPSDLTTRLKVPDSDDELAKLAQTLNAMLSRIEKGFRSIEQFTADASHELRAPLALIITGGEVSLRRGRTHEELTDTLQKIVQEARRMSKLVEDLLQLARGDADRIPTEFATADLPGILRELTTELEPVALAKGLRLTSTCPHHEILVAGTASDLRRLFLILIDNAIKYTESGAIVLGLCVEGSQVKVTVADSGIGIEQAALPHVFDRFWRADKVRSRAEGGAGLGLALAAQIGRRNGGSISVESKVGQGSTFTVQLQAAGA
jgi:heavy metal sensor kinase